MSGMLVDASGSGTVLGLDIGATSVGWALLSDADAGGGRILAAGVRCFEAGVEGDIEKGQDASRAAARRLARLARRQLQRRARRLAKVFRTLQAAGLLPIDPSDINSDPQQRHHILEDLDRSLREQYLAHGTHVEHQLLPYTLRKMAATGPLPPHALGRAFYHLAQRRGFKSNRKSQPKPDEKPGVVKQGIQETAQLIAKATPPTLGAAMASLDPHHVRIRQRYTERRMYEAEFEAIWNVQAPHHPQTLTPEFKRQLHRAIFYQRKMKSAKHLIGKCSIDGKRRRSPIAIPVAQELRLLQKVNDLLIRPKGEPECAPTAEQRKQLIHALEHEGDVTFARLRELWGLKRTTKFNLEEGGEPKLPGNRTNAALRPLFGAKWDAMTDDQREYIVEDILSFDSTDALARSAQRRWGLSESDALALADTPLEQSRSAYCKPVLRKLVARLRDGTPLSTARLEEYPDTFAPRQPDDLLPPVRQAVTDIKNPAVIRALTETRKVVNALIRKHGKPDTIRVEFARDLKRPRQERIDASKKMRENQTERDRARTTLLKEAGLQRASRAEIEKWILAEEAAMMCPYCGMSIGGPKEVSDSGGALQVEHILPRRYLDNSFVNKTIACSKCNHEKGDRSPHEAFGSDPQRWQEILGRVARFKTKAMHEKLRRFQLTRQEIVAQFGETYPSRALNDTRYTSRLAAEYLGRLYGGKTDATNKQRVFTTPGQLTALLRAQWDLNSVLWEMPDAVKMPPEQANDFEAKLRADHRHHAIDAIVVALTEPGTVKRAGDAAEDAYRRHQRRLQIAEPWPGFRDDVKTAIGRIVVSHRVRRKVAGPLHAETNYSPLRPTLMPDGRVVDKHRVRKPLARMSKSEVERIIDKAVREAVQTSLGSNDPQRYFNVEANLPRMRHGSDSLPVRCARIWVSNKPFRVGKQHRAREVDSGGDTLHHTEIVSVQKRTGERWEDHPVDRLEANCLRSHGQPVVREDWPHGSRLVMWLCKNDCIEMEGESGHRRVYVVRSVSKSDIVVRLHHDARIDKQVQASGERSIYRLRSADILRERHARKVTISPIGEVLDAGDGADYRPGGTPGPSADGERPAVH